MDNKTSQIYRVEIFSEVYGLCIYEVGRYSIISQRGDEEQDKFITHSINLEYGREEKNGIYVQIEDVLGYVENLYIDKEKHVKYYTSPTEELHTDMYNNNIKISKEEQELESDSQGNTIKTQENNRKRVKRKGSRKKGEETVREVRNRTEML